MIESQPSLFGFIDCLISKSTSQLKDHKISVKKLRRVLRIQSYNLNFVFQKGPHKYSVGKTVFPRASLCEKLFEIIKCEAEKFGDDKKVCRLEGLVNSLPKNKDLTSELIFLYLIAGNPGKCSDVVTYDQCEAYLNPESSVSYSRLTGLGNSRCISPFSSVKLHSRIPIDTFALQSKNMMLSSRYASECFLSNTNRITPYTSSSFNIDPPSVFSSIQVNNFIKPNIPEVSRCSPIYSDADCSGPSPRTLDEDEGYCESFVRTDYRLLNNDNIENTILRLFSQFSTAVGQLLVNEIFYSSFNPYFKLISSDKTMLANKSLDTILPLISQSCIQSFSWESRGIGYVNKELPYLSETGPISAEAVLAAKKWRFGFLSSGHETDDTQSTIQFRRTTLKSVLAYNDDFLHDLLLMRIGIQSSRFQFSGAPRSIESQHKCTTNPFSYPLSDHFLWVPNKCDPLILGISSECLSHFVNYHVQAGTKYRQLCWFAHHSISLIPTSASDNSVWLGQIWACFIHGLKTWLRLYENSVQSILSKLSNSNESRLLLFTESLRNLSSQIEFISDLCMLNYKQSDISMYPLTKLHGVELLAYLMSKADCSMCHPSEHIVRFLFKEAARPLIKFLEAFVLDGIYDDIGNEFNLIVSDEHLFKQDNSFWTKTFHFSTYDQILNIDIGTENLIRVSLSQLLPSGFEKEMLCCAKSVLLLKSICPKHFLFQTRSQFPSLCFLETVEEISDHKDKFEKYQKLLQDTAVEHSATRKQKIAQMTIERQNFLKFVNQIRSAKLAAFEAKRREQLEAYLTKQQAEFTDLKLAAENAAKQRHEAIEAEKKADQMLLESISLSDKYREEVIAEVKAELESYYGKLMQEADKRRINMEKRIKDDIILIETLEPDSSKALEFKADRMVSVNECKSNESSGKEEPLVKIGSIMSKQLAEINVIPSEVIHQDIINDQLEYHTMENDGDKIVDKCDDSLISDDPLTILRFKFRQRNKSGCVFKDQMSEIIYGDRDRNSIAKSVTPESAQSVDAHSVNTLRTPVESFRQRNTFGHSSDSTIQHILYGKGLGPSSRPSVWEAQRNKEDAVRLATEPPEPDAVTFYKEVLESSENTLTVKPFTKEFPSLDQNCCIPVSSYVFTNYDSSVKSLNLFEKSAKDTNNSLSIPLRLLINRSLIWPLSIHMKHVNNTLCNYFIFDLRVCDHFYCLYETYFLTNGCFAQPLLSVLFHKAAGPVHDRANLYDTNYLQQLLKSVIIEMSGEQLLSDLNSDDAYNNDESMTTISPLLNTTHLIKNYLDVISLSTSPTTATATSRRQSPVYPLNDDFDVESVYSVDNGSSLIDQNEYISFKNLHLLYKAPWPISLCFNSNIMKKYNCIFQRLVQCQFALWALNSCIMQLKHDRNYCLNHLLSLKSMSSSTTKTVFGISSASSTTLVDQLSKSFHCIYLWLFELHQVIHNLNMHLYNHINACWSKFIRHLGLSNTRYDFTSEGDSLKVCKRTENVVDSEEYITSEQQDNNLDSLFNEHESYLNEIISGFLLDVSDNELNLLFQGLLSCAHQFHRALLTGRWIVKPSLHSQFDVG
ncbi:Gamma-tubulin complex component 6 [Schistosoma japonicum]|nr:Gamma-tubulin complex component 6 [Schistosoma japonicum]